MLRPIIGDPWDKNKEHCQCSGLVCSCFPLVKFEETSELIIVTEGINMLDIRKIDGIDLTRTYCNDIQTIYKYYGIEAARSANLLLGRVNVVSRAASVFVEAMDGFCDQCPPPDLMS